MPAVDMAQPIFDFASLPCTSAPQSGVVVSGTTPHGAFTARVGVAGWSWGEGACNGQPTVYLYAEGAPALDPRDTTGALRIYDGASHWSDLGATRDAFVSYDDGATVWTVTGQVTWTRRDDFLQPGGVLEGDLSVDTGGFKLHGHFIANRCERFDQHCI